MNSTYKMTNLLKEWQYHCINKPILFQSSNEQLNSQVLSCEIHLSFCIFLVTVWWRTCWLWWWSQGWWHHQIYQGQPTSSCYRIQWWGKSYKITCLLSSHLASKEKPKGFPENCTGDQTSHGRLRIVRSITEVFNYCIRHGYVTSKSLLSKLCALYITEWW